MKTKYQSKLCWCLKDTDPEPEYQEHLHYEDPEENTSTGYYEYSIKAS